MKCKDTYKESATCKMCGWDFVVHVPEGLDTGIYPRPCKWFCPHCGNETLGNSRHSSQSAPRIAPHGKSTT